MGEATQAEQAPSQPVLDPLSNMPSELIASICDRLDKKDLHNIRLTSKSLCAKSYKSKPSVLSFPLKIAPRTYVSYPHALDFYSHHFRVSSFTFTRNGLEKLVEFSRDPNINVEIKVLRLVIVAFPTRGKEHLTGAPYTPDEATAEALAVIGADRDTMKATIKLHQKKIRRTRRRAYGHYQDDQNFLRRKGVDVNLLAEALRHLPVLQDISTVDIYGTDLPRGVGKIIGDLGTMPFTTSMLSWIYVMQDSYESRFEVERELKNVSAHSVGAVLGAIHRSGIKFNGNLQFVGVPHCLKFAKLPHCSRLSLSSTPPRTFAMSMLDDMKDTLSRIKGLRISMFSYVYRRRLSDPIDADEFEWLYQLLERTNTLGELMLNDNSTMGRNFDLGIMRCIEDRAITLPRLREFWLTNAYCDTRCLISFVDKHNTTLRRIYLDNTNLRTTTPA